VLLSTAKQQTQQQQQQQQQLQCRISAGFTPPVNAWGGGGTGAANGSLKLSRLFVFLTVGSVAHQLLTYSCWPLLLLLPPGCPLFQPAKAIAEAGDVS
jgi:hypothetical protein